MNAAFACLADTLHLLLEEARQAAGTAASARGQPAEAFEAGRSQALIEVLHTWVNQVETFGCDAELTTVVGPIRAFLADHGY